MAHILHFYVLVYKDFPSLREAREYLCLWLNATNIVTESVSFI